MSLFCLAILIPAIYFGTALLLYILDGWFNFSKDDNKELATICWLWPLVLLFLPIFIGEWIRGKLIAARKKKEERLLKEDKVKTSLEKELEAIQEDIDSELASQKKI